MKNYNRLLLGERDSVIREAGHAGGIYIDPHPEAISMLQAAQIDPYIIYERGVIAQLEKKIPRIDYVQADVNELFEQWSGQPDSQIPIHVRLIFWLKNNAAAYGYVQNGNSWILK